MAQPIEKTSWTNIFKNIIRHLLCWWVLSSCKNHCSLLTEWSTLLLTTHQQIHCVTPTVWVNKLCLWIYWSMQIWSGQDQYSLRFASQRIKSCKIRRTQIVCLLSGEQIDCVLILVGSYIGNRWGGGGRSSDPSSPPVLHIICTNIPRNNLYLYMHIYLRWTYGRSILIWRESWRMRIYWLPSQPGNSS